MTLDRTRPPEPLEPVPFGVPAAFRTTMPNGLRVVIVDDERIPLCNYRLVFLTGDANEPRNEIGINSALASMLTEGTENYSSRELAEKIERLGASLSASSNDDFTVISASALSMYSADIIELMSEVVFAPTFPENELDLYRRNTIEGLKFQRSQPPFLANEQVARLLYGEHPYSTVSPKPADIERLNREALAAARRREFLPNNAVFIAVGDVRKDELMLQLEDHLGDWEAGDRHVHDFPSAPVRTAKTLTIVDRPGSAQANIVIANRTIPRNHKDYFPLLVMNQVLGAGASSRVFMNLREEKGYTYGAYTRLDTKRFDGSIEATAEVRTAVTGDSLKEFFYELNRIRDERVLEEEIDDAKNYLTGVFPIRAETQEGLTSLIVSQEIYGLPHDYLETYRENIEAVTADEIQRVANEYIRPSEMAIVTVGDAAEILPQAREWADSVEIFDKDGNERPVTEYEISADADVADVAGEWTLALNFMGSDVEIKMHLEQDGSSVNGKLVTMLGEGTISGGRVQGSKVTATAVTELQGQEVEFAITGTADGGSIAGAITSAMLPGDLEFKGTRAA
ncbi:MAG: insulinase family protein [Acidobacteria bacterium]|nr:insulinase family protein [Acidobacteriota bacterium]